MRGAAWRAAAPSCRDALCYYLVSCFASQGLSAFPFGNVKCIMEFGSWAFGPWKVRAMRALGHVPANCGCAC